MMIYGRCLSTAFTQAAQLRMVWRPRHASDRRRPRNGHDAQARSSLRGVAGLLESGQTDLTGEEPASCDDDEAATTLVYSWEELLCGRHPPSAGHDAQGSQVNAWTCTGLRVVMTQKLIN